MHTVSYTFLNPEACDTIHHNGLENIMRLTNQGIDDNCNKIKAALLADGKTPEHVVPIVEAITDIVSTLLQGLNDVMTDKVV